MQAFDEINWAKEPADDHERAIRSAIIARIEAERSSGLVGGPFMVLSALQSLSEGSEVASDLSAALDRWHRQLKEQTAEKKRLEHQRLFELAVRQIEGASNF